MAAKKLHGSAAYLPPRTTVCKLSFLSVSLQHGLQLYIHFSAFMACISFPLWLSAGWLHDKPSTCRDFCILPLLGCSQAPLFFYLLPNPDLNVPTLSLEFRLLYVAWITPSWLYELPEVIILKLLGRYADRNFGIRDNLREIRLIEGNAKYRLKKNWPVKGLCGRCLSV